MRDKEKTKAYKKAYYQANKDKFNAQTKAYYLGNKEHCTAYAKVYNLANKEKIREHKKKWYQANKEKRKIYAKAYLQANPEIFVINKRKRRALKINTYHEKYTDTYIFERDGWICGICGRKINKRLKHPNPLSKSIDHIVPLIKGGVDAPVNVQAAHLRCNLGKGVINKGQLRLIG